MHSFIHKNQTLLTLEEIGQRAPSALATRPYDAMSARYTYVPTLGVIEAMIAAGFRPFSATQSRTRIVGKGEFTKHLIRFRHQDVGPLAVGGVVPEVVLINSHDGTSAYKLIAGLYRLICSNGMMVSDGEIDSINVAHKGNIVQDVLDGSYRLIVDTQKSLGTVQNWTHLQLTDGEQHEFAESAHTLRFADSDGKVTTPITADQLLAPRRREDIGGDLWHTLNRIQENVIAGGLSAIQRNAGGRRVRRVTTRRISGIDQDVKLNRALWQLAIGIPKDSEHVGAGIEDFLQLGAQLLWLRLLFATENLDSSESQPPMFRAVVFPAQPDDIERLAVVRMMTLNLQCSAIAAWLTFHAPTADRL